MAPFAWIGAAAAALVVSALIMLKGGMVERPAKRMPIADAGGGSPSGAGIPELGDDQEDPFKRYPRPREGAAAGPEPTQTETQMLSNGDGWAPEPASEPAWSYASPGDPTPTPLTRPTTDSGPASAAWYAATGEPGHLPTPQRTSPTPVPTADPNVFRIPGTNIKMT